MKRILLLISFFNFTYSAFAQLQSCAQDTFPEAFRQYMIRTSNEANNYSISENRAELRDVALNIVLIQYDDGPIVTPQFVQLRVDEVNEIFSPINLHFSICSIQYVPYPSEMAIPPGLITWSQEIEQYITEQAYLPGYLNIFYALGDGPNASLPLIGSSDRVLMNNGSAKLFAHELAHYFSLIHTHAFNGYSTNVYTLELVDGSNCETEGDFICDTPADPGLFGRIAPYPACEYIDTVTVDANGDLYTPEVDNYMCATYNTCITHFTPQQYSRMAYCLDHERAYLKSGNLGVVMDSIPRKVCIDQEPIVLNSVLSGGVFSGPGVIDDVFYPEIAGNGNHLITYTATSAESVLESTDAYYPYHDTIYSQTSSWQSFTSTEAGGLTGFSFSMIHELSQLVDYTVYSGSGLTGVVLNQGTFNAAINNELTWNKIVFNSPIQVNPGELITVQISASNPYHIAGMRSNTYSGGQSNLIVDLSFITHVIPNELNCGNTISSHIAVGESTLTIVEDLFPSYCPNAPSSEPTFYPSGGELFIDGLLGSTIDPTILSPGIHQMNYIYTNNFGCITNTFYDLNIGQTVSVSLEEGTAFCADNSSIDLILNPLGGDLFLDGSPLINPQIDLSQLANGGHILNYIKSNEYFWKDTLDVYWEPLNTNYVYSIANNSTIWQSFSPTTKGFIDAVNLGLYSNYITPVTYQLFEGTGTSGSLLYSGSTSFGAQSTYLQKFDFPDFQFLLEQDSAYTIAVTFTNANSTTANAHFQMGYENGTSSYAYPGLEVDIRFGLLLNPMYMCAADTATRQFTIVDNFLVDLGPDIVATVGQTLSLDAGNAGNQYLWSTGETTQTIEFEFDSGISQYWVTVFNDAGCSSSDTIAIELVTELQLLNSESMEVTLFPNPVKDNLRVNSTAPISAIHIFNTLGQRVFQSKIESATQIQEIPISHLSDGLYVIIVFGPQGNSSQRFIKTKE